MNPADPTGFMWRKSSYSNGQTECVELGWRKSSRSNHQGACVELGWRKSSHSNGQAECVEVAHAPGAVRDSKNPGPTLAINLSGLLTAIRSGHLDH